MMDDWIPEDSFDWARFSIQGTYLLLRTSKPVNATVSFQVYRLPPPNPNAIVPSIRRGEPKSLVSLGAFHPRDAAMLPGSDSIILFSGGSVDPMSPTSTTPSRGPFGSLSPTRSAAPTSSSVFEASGVAANSMPNELVLCQFVSQAKQRHIHKLTQLSRITFATPVLRSLPIADRIVIITVDKVHIFDVGSQRVIAAIPTAQNPNAAAAVTTDFRGHPILAIPSIPPQKPTESNDVQRQGDTTQETTRKGYIEVWDLYSLTVVCQFAATLHDVHVIACTPPNSISNDQTIEESKRSRELSGDVSPLLVAVASSRSASVHIFSLKPKDAQLVSKSSQGKLPDWETLTAHRPAAVLTLTTEHGTNDTASHASSESLDSKSAHPNAQTALRPSYSVRHVCSLRRGIVASVSTPAGLALAGDGSQLVVWTLGLLPELRVFDLPAGDRKVLLDEIPLSQPTYAPDKADEEDKPGLQASEDEDWVLELDLENSGVPINDDNEFVFCDTDATDDKSTERRANEVVPLGSPRMVVPSHPVPLETPQSGAGTLNSTATTPSNAGSESAPTESQPLASSAFALLRASTRKIGAVASDLFTFLAGSRNSVTSTVTSTAAATAAATVQATATVGAKVRDTVHAGLATAHKARTRMSGRVIRMRPLVVRSQAHQDPHAHSSPTSASSEYALGSNRSIETKSNTVANQSLRVLDAAYLLPALTQDERPQVSHLRLGVITNDGGLTIFTTPAGRSPTIESVHRLIAPSPYDASEAMTAPFVLHAPVGSDETLENLTKLEKFPE